ncbi:unnamed protein product [Urochloa humidicola]
MSRKIEAFGSEADVPMHFWKHPVKFTAQEFCSSLFSNACLLPVHIGSIGFLIFNGGKQWYESTIVLTCDSVETTVTPVMCEG